MHSRYDGIVWPELMSKPGGWRSWFDLNSAKSKEGDAKFLETIEKFPKVQDLKLSDHVKYRTSALQMYLEGTRDQFTNQDSLTDPLQFIETINAIVLSLLHNYLHYQDWDHSWEFNEVSEVHMYEYIYDLCMKTNVTGFMETDPNRTSEVMR